MPILDSIIRETTRVAQPHAAMRRNLGPELCINNKTIPTGAYVIYPFSDVHLNPEIYADPWKFDPSRKEPTHVPFSYVGWGGGMDFLHCAFNAVTEIDLFFLQGGQHASALDSPKLN